MNLALLVMTDGRRDCISRTIPSAEANLRGPIRWRIIHDDSGDPNYATWLQLMHPTYQVISTPGRSGFGGAIRSAWAQLAQLPDLTHVFHLEDDFTFNREVDLHLLAETLDDHPHLAQLALRRQPWNPQEAAAGGIVEQHPREYVECCSDRGRWLEHRLFFTTNPCMYRRAVLDVGWPDGAESEGRFGIGLRTDGFDSVPGARVRFGYWGGRLSGEWVHHIGHRRAGVGY